MVDRANTPGVSTGTGDEAVVHYFHSDSGLLFEWGGGAYVAMGAACECDDYAGPHVNADDGEALNVWDEDHEMSRFEVGTGGTRRPLYAVLVAFEKFCNSTAEAESASWVSEE